MWVRRKTHTGPCEHPECPTPESGKTVGPGAVTPTRISGKSVGFDGVLCFECYYGVRNEADFLAQGRVSRRTFKWWGRRLGDRSMRQLVLPGFKDLVA
jgi:hypothetical protein